MRIAVISDTHDRYPPPLPEQLRGADEIWHLGDVCAPNTLAAFAQLGPSLRVVAGNCDAYPWPLTLDLEREGYRLGNLSEAARPIAVQPSDIPPARNHHRTNSL